MPRLFTRIARLFRPASPQPDFHKLSTALTGRSVMVSRAEADAIMRSLEKR